MFPRANSHVSHPPRAAASSSHPSSSSNLSPLAPPFNVDRPYYPAQSNSSSKPPPSLLQSYASSEISSPQFTGFPDCLSLQSPLSRRYDGLLASDSNLLNIHVESSYQPCSYGFPSSVSGSVSSLDVMERLAGFEGASVGCWDKKVGAEVVRRRGFLDRDATSPHHFSNRIATLQEKDPKVERLNMSHVNHNDSVQALHRTNAAENIQETSFIHTNLSQLPTRSTHIEASVAYSNADIPEIGVKPKTMLQQSSNSFYAGLPLPRDYTHTVSVTHDQLQDTDVLDSPCWKGSSAYRSFLNSNEPPNIHFEGKDSGSSNELDQNRQRIQSAVCPDTSAYLEENVGSSNRIFYSPIETLNERTRPFVSPNNSHKLEASIFSTLGNTESHYEGFESSDAIQEQSKEVRKYKFDESAWVEDKNDEVCRERQAVVSNQSKLVCAACSGFSSNSATNVVASNLNASSSTQLTALPSKISGTTSCMQQFGDQSNCRRWNMFAKVLYDLSEELLSFSSFGYDEIMDNEWKLLQATITNIETFLLKNNKGDENNSSHVSGTQFLGSNIRTLEADILDLRLSKKLDNASALNARRPTQVLSEYYASNFQDLNCFSTLPNEAIKNATARELEHDLPSEIYYKLWVDAEASLCSMKYELQLAHMNLKILKQKHHKAQSEGQSNVRITVTDPEIRYLSLSPSNLSEQNRFVSADTQSTSKGKEVVDPSVMSRFNILKERSSQSNVCV